MIDAALDRMTLAQLRDLRDVIGAAIACLERGGAPVVAIRADEAGLWLRVLRHEPQHFSPLPFVIEPAGPPAAEPPPPAEPPPAAGPLPGADARDLPADVHPGGGPAELRGDSRPAAPEPPPPEPPPPVAAEFRPANPVQERLAAIGFDAMDVEIFALTDIGHSFDQIAAETGLDVRALRLRIRRVMDAVGAMPRGFVLMQMRGMQAAGFPVPPCA